MTGRCSQAGSVGRRQPGHQSVPFQTLLIPSANSERRVSLGDRRIALGGAEQAVSPPGLQAGRGEQENDTIQGWPE